MDEKGTIEQRIKDWRGFCASNRIKYKEVAVRAGLNHVSVKTNMRENNLSHDRMTLLEDAALEIHSERNLQPQSN